MAFSEGLKFEVKKKAHQSCCICKSIGIEIHHIVPQSEGGSDDIDNAAPLCPNCHEIYGQNPTKRKFIRESRQIWFEICEKRFKNDDQLYSQLMERLNRLESSIIKKIDNKDNNTAYDTGMTIGNILDYLVNLKYPSTEVEAKNLEFTFNFIFEILDIQDGDSDFEIEMFERRKLFINIFGKYFCNRLIAYMLWKTKLDWIVGVIEKEVEDFVIALNIIMILILSNFDICRPPDRLKCFLTEDGDFKFMLFDDSVR
jgi:hypothetical protein